MLTSQGMINLSGKTSVFLVQSFSFYQVHEQILVSHPTDIEPNRHLGEGQNEDLFRGFIGDLFQDLPTSHLGGIFFGDGEDRA